MKKKGCFMVLAIVALSVFISGQAMADLPGAGWWTGIQIVNTDAVATGSVMVTLYDKNSAATYDSVSKSIGPNQSANFSPFTAADWVVQPPSGFVGSAVASSEVPIKAIVSIQNNSGTTGTAGATYNGLDQSTRTLLFPLVKNVYGGSQRSTTFYVQNTDIAAGTIDVTYRIGATTYTHQYAGVEPNKMVVINPADAGVPPTSLGSLEVNSTVNIVGIYNEHQASASLANVLLATEGFSNTAADIKLYAPLFKQNYNTAYSGLQVMNTSATPATITATFRPVGGGSYPYTTPNALGQYESFTFFNVPGWPAGYGSVVLESAQPIIAIVNETKYSTGQSGVYSAFANSSLTNHVSAPLWKTRWSGTGSGQQTAIVVQNAGTGDAAVTTTFTMTAGGIGVFTPADRTLTQYESTTYGPGSFAGGPPTGTPALGSVDITATQNIAVLVQESTLPGWTPRDTLNYEGFNL
jgi:hypothetical protein